MTHAQSSLEKLQLSKIEALLTTSWLGQSDHANELWKTIDSTNNRAMELARLGAPHGVMVIASEQSAGRGRNGNQWLSPAGSGVYISFLIRPNLATVNLPVITLVAGVAVTKAIQGYLGIEIGLKWVNDLIVDGKKVGGILSEYVASNKQSESYNTKSPNENMPALIIGIGLNIRQSNMQLPAELEQKMGFLDTAVQGPGDKNLIDSNQLVASIANELEIAFDQVQAGQLSILLDQWRAYSITLGEEIVANIGDKQIIGQALDITNSGELIVKTKAGNVTLSAGEVSIRKPGGTYI